MPLQLRLWRFAAGWTGLTHEASIRIPSGENARGSGRSRAHPKTRFRSAFHPVLRAATRRRSSSPMPPAPIGETISYGPSLSPAESGISGNQLILSGAAGGLLPDLGIPEAEELVCAFFSRFLKRKRSQTARRKPRRKPSAAMPVNKSTPAAGSGDTGPSAVPV